MSSAKWSWFYTTILEYIKWFLVEKIRLIFWMIMMIVTVIEFVIVNFRARFVNLGHRKNISRSNVWLTKLAWRLPKNSRDRLMLRLVLQVLLRGHDNLLLQAFLRGPTTKQSKSSYGDSNHPKSSYGDRSHTKSSCWDRDLPK